ncbi:hypothetical protein D0876_26050 (plasmid) [Klebsiella pneumoniae]|nr:hypothetical protein D0876_26050 [Klebsiella pneumoniae]HBX3080266.1 hypothetical protein [Klebsiella pneumoniae]HBY4994118.1 hypothetical protein [Klebsiella pneumoniae]HBZ2549534.1 hypothetical protein [Klebsiella pneumoniae]
MACCIQAAIAPALVIQKCCEMSPSEKNFFLMPWLATSLKQRLLWCEMAPDIEWLLKHGSQLAVNARLGIIACPGLTPAPYTVRHVRLAYTESRLR